MNRARATALCVLLPMLALSGCASAPSTFPSLAIRDAERVSGTIAAPAATPTPMPPPLAPAQLGGLMATVRAGHTAFAGATAAARRAVEAARGSGSGSDAWSVAQVAVANLEAQRSQVMIALADIDRIHVDATINAQDTSQTRAALDEANGLIAQENAEIDRLLAALGG